MTIVREPRVDLRPEQPTLGIRTVVPMRVMSANVGKLLAELRRWADQHGVQPAGPSFLRLHVIDMAGEMDIEVGFPVAEPLAGDERVRPGSLPVGRYASLVYTGAGIAGNKALLVWAREQGLRFDRWDDPKGDAFRSRIESFLTDPQAEPRKTKWQTEVAIKLADEG
jgi:effector-binding domain-containing protein